mgnify:CR=1 FL=1
MVIHYTAMASTESARRRLSDPASEVSAHYLISRGGSVIQLVDEAERAWHAGAGSWQGRGDVNSRSSGIELTNTGQEPFGERQMAALETLLAGVLARWGLGPDAVIGHQDMAPWRKPDPGPRFDWRRLALGGLSIWPSHSGDPAIPFCDSAARFGYPAPGSAPDAGSHALLAAFRARFRPGAMGPEDAGDRALLAGLADEWGGEWGLDRRGDGA